LAYWVTLRDGVVELEDTTANNCVILVGCVAAPARNLSPHKILNDVRVRRQAVGVTERDRIVPRVRIQIDAAGQPDGILGQQDPLRVLEAEIEWASTFTWASWDAFDLADVAFPSTGRCACHATHNA